MFDINAIVISSLAYAPALAFIGGLLTEEILLLLALLAGGGLISLSEVVIF